MQFSSSETGELRPPLDDKQSQYLEDNLYIFNYFYEYPTLENYMIVQHIYDFCPEWNPHKIYSLKMRDFYNTGDDLTGDEKSHLKETEKYVLHRNNVLTMEELDILRYLYFASGCRKYMKRIKYAVSDTRQNPHIRSTVKLYM